MKSRYNSCTPPIWAVAVVVAVAGLLMPSQVPASEVEAIELSPAQLAADVDVPAGARLVQDTAEPAAEPMTAKESVSADDWTSPLSLSIGYGIYSDYIFRFVNFSEFPGEGREDLNHQLTLSIGYDFGDFGSLSYTGWVEWFNGEEELSGNGSAQEVDHAIEWGYSLEDISTDLALGMVFYAFPNAKELNTIEWYLSLSHNDAWMWQWLFPENEDPILSPSFLLVHDVDELGGLWMEFGFSHDFELFENFTLTPGYMVAVDAGYWNDSCRMGGDQYSLVASYDLSSALQLPKSAGSLSVSGELYWNNPWGNLENEGTAEDVLWGGLAVGWEWGG